MTVDSAYSREHTSHMNSTHAHYDIDLAQSARTEVAATVRRLHNDVAQLAALLTDINDVASAKLHEAATLINVAASMADDTFMNQINEALYG